jgi:hypothetical protein
LFSITPGIERSEFKAFNFDISHFYSKVIIDIETQVKVSLSGSPSQGSSVALGVGRQIKNRDGEILGMVIRLGLESQEYTQWDIETSDIVILGLKVVHSDNDESEYGISYDFAPSNKLRFERSKVNLRQKLGQKTWLFVDSDRLAIDDRTNSIDLSTLNVSPVFRFGASSNLSEEGSLLIGPNLGFSQNAFNGGSSVLYFNPGLTFRISLK